MVRRSATLASTMDFFAASSANASSLVFRSNAVSNIISGVVECRCLALQAVEVLEGYAGCRRKACTVPERLGGMGKSEWGLGMLHGRLGFVLLFLAY